ncbi:ArnT family glycosyltransferase [Mycolicibacterium pallens]|uniref:Glycosyltransferase family 39 protein n=1 Tax=Mycolicibacterium pallens TaxID=370524 RepID=A0ABX8VMG7_9MYCO|nr:glycosyltransferase family 39 protein [Mycolicibacterium pallens]QYL16746.1 glycosyltransferase family 39 protein [Mycolicibacterium pallens]
MTMLAEHTERPTVIDPQDEPRALRPRWVRPALGLLLAVTALLYLWGLDAAGWANEYYAAAVQAGTQSWKALLFGSIDAGNAITVDKPPAALWVMALSGRIFGFSTLSMLVPQALMGVASVALVYSAVRRVSGYGAGLLAGAVLALTPVAALMFRFNNPDALLVLLMVVAAYCVVRALDGKSTRWIALAGVAIGFAFLTKLLQALLVTPAFALVVLVAIPGSVWRRLRDLAIGLIAMVVSAGWYLALVSLWPSESRPYIGGSTNNSLLQLALGYNGLGRVFGGDGNPGGSSGSGGGPGPMGGSMFGGSTGITRMFGESMGTEISWLLPAALIALVAGLWFTRRAPRTDRTRAALLLWGGWLVVTVVVFSFMKGIMHPYYTIALAPAIGAVIGIGVRELWRGRDFAAPRIVLATMLVVTGVWNFILLDRTPEWMPWLRWTVLVGAILVSAVLVAGAHRLGRWTVAVAAAGLLFGLGATAAYTVETVAGSHGGGIPTSGPARAGGGFGFGGPGGPGGQEVLPSDNSELKDLLLQADNRWAAATVGSHVAGSLELATGTSIMSIGGFSGGDNSPTLEQFQNYVASGQVHYFIVGGGPGGNHRGGPGGESGTGTQITQWVQQHFTAQDIGGTEVYDLSAPK